MKKNIQIVTVPTGKQGWNKGDIVVIHGEAMISDSDTPDWHNLATKWSAKQLLVLSDDEIQEGNVCLSRETGEVFTCKENHSDLDRYSHLQKM